MDCEKMIPLISGHLDGCNSKTEENSLQEHLAQCPHCRALLKQIEENDQLLAHMVEPPADLSKRIMDAVRKSPPKAKSKRRYTSFAAAGLATAALLALVFFGSTALPGMGTDSAAMEVAREPAAEGSDTTSYCLSQDAISDISTDDTAFSYGDANGGSLISPPVEASEIADEESATASDQVSKNGSQAYQSAEDSEIPTPGSLPLRRARSDIYGLTGADGAVQELPTLIIREADITDFPQLEFLPLDTEPQTVPMVFSPDSDFYERFLSTLPTGYILEGSGTLRNTAQFSLHRYTLSYDSFSALLETATGKYELSLYFPADLTETQDCLVIFICSEE